MRPRRPPPAVLDADPGEEDAAAPWDASSGARNRGGERHGGHQHSRERRPPFSRAGRRDAAASFEEDGKVWIWGLHAVAAALANPRRRIALGLATRNAAARLGFETSSADQRFTLSEPDEIDRRLPAGAVHQGAAVLAEPLAPLELADVVLRPERPLAILDQVTDPQNVGAIFRSAAAFGVGGMILQTRNAPALGGALAKAAAGAIEAVDEIRVVNIARAVAELKDSGWCVVGLDRAADADLADALATPMPVALVLGAEGAGLRQGVSAACSRLARIPIGPAAESLNVSNAAAIAFYELARRRR